MWTTHWVQQREFGIVIFADLSSAKSEWREHSSDASLYVLYLIMALDEAPSLNDCRH